MSLDSLGCLFIKHLQKRVGWGQQVWSVQQEASEHRRVDLWLDGREQGLQFQAHTTQTAANEVELLRWRLEHKQTMLLNIWWSFD